MGVGGGAIGAAMTRLNGRGMTAGGLSGTAGPSMRRHKLLSTLMSMMSTDSNHRPANTYNSRAFSFVID